jgi:CRISPR-associated protein Csb2
MPWFKKGPEDRTFIFDTFVVVSPESTLMVRWPEVSLDELQRRMLSQIVANLNTLGRSESWCQVELLGDDYALHNMENPAIDRISVPLDSADAPPNAEIVRLLCPDPESAFAEDFVVSVRRNSVGRGKTKNAIEVQSTIYDPAWNMCMETLQLHKERWSDPPGSRWVTYVRSMNCFNQHLAPTRRLSRARPEPQIVRFALDSTVLPLVTETLPVAESARRMLMGIHGSLTECDSVQGRSKTFSGKDSEGNPLSGHSHAYYLPTDEDGDGRLDHLTILARSGFDKHEMCAVDSLRVLKNPDRNQSGQALRVLLLGWGQLEEFHAGPVQASRVWNAVTPYVATRYAKTRGRERIDLCDMDAVIRFLRDNLLRQLVEIRADIPDVNAVGIEPMLEGGAFKISSYHPIQFKRFRHKSSDDGGRRLSGAFRIAFPDVIRGPIALGHSAHFGLGLFMPVKG